MSISVRVKTRKNNLRALKKKMLKLHNQKTYYGFFGEQGDHSEWGISYVDLMAINEFGTEEIPPRPVFTKTIQISKRMNKPIIKSSLSRYFYSLKTFSDVQSVLASSGKFFGRETAANFGSSSFLTPNHPFTIESKGFDAPLVWTGELRANIAYTTTVDSSIKLVN